MKLIFFIITVACVQVSAIGYSQNVTIQQKDATLTTVFSSIEKQTGYSFFWKNEDLTKLKVDVKLQNASLEEALKEVFKGLPLTYSIVKKSIVVQAKAPNLIDRVAALFAGIDVFGIVIDTDNNPLAGATIVIKGTKRSTTTATAGQFALNDVPEDAMLQISYMGYVTKEIKVSAIPMAIKLELSTSKLDEVQVMAYGKTNRRLSTGNIVTVTAKELEQQPVQNPLLALQGRVAGMIVTPTNGYAGSPVKIEIRGRKTISPDFVSDPLYIIDGVPLNNLDLGSGSNYERGSQGVVQNGFSVTGGQSPFYNLNSKDIESIEVLKDGDATAIYGSRAANGVILITTKKGKSGETKFSANIDQGFSAVTQRWDMLNTQQYLEIRREAFKNDNITPTANNAPDLVLWDPNKYTDWQKELWGKIGKQTNVSMSLAGGDVQTQFRISGNYGKQTEILSSKGSNQRGSLAFNLGHSTKDRRFRADLNGNYSYSAINTIGSPSLVTLAPNAPDIYDENGVLNFAPWRASGPDINFPFSGLDNPYTSNTNMITSSLRLSYKILQNLSVSTNIGYNSSNNANKFLGYISAQDPLSNPRGSTFSGTTNNYNWLIEPQIDYHVKLFGGELTALLGGSTQKTATNAFGIYGFNFESDDFIESISMAPFTLITQNQGFYKYAAVFGRIKYSWEDKYIININGRRDGSSRFGPGKQFGNFGSIGAAWIASKEDWAKNVLPSFISFVKLRGSYGLTGSDAIGDYKYLTRWSSGHVENTPLPDYDGEKPLVSMQAVNPNYKWQVNKKSEIALNLSFFDDRINLETAIYKERSGNQLTSYPTPLYTGFPSVTANWPALIENGGWEFTFNAKVIDTKDINWTLTFNGSRNYNKLLAYPDIENSPYALKLQVGKSLNTKYLFHYTGVDPLSGSYTFEDYNKNGYVQQTTFAPGKGLNDQYVELDLTPKFTGGLGSQFSYKNFSFGCFFDFRNQIGADPNYISGLSIGGFGNQPADIIGNYWKKPGDNAKYSKASTITDQGYNNYANSDAIYRNSSYVRLSNVSLAYTLNQKLLKKLGAESVSVYMNAQNVFVISKAGGIDPELQMFGALPPARVFLCGLSLNF
ncbi:SusC/RagA family TonB-linked outer membrane protein [Pedobacter sp. ok626]|uniref:SusC/RagA family TonB-linked outer membrane protein n=1 Tax=Pedobacter sp. ok626 TaxID=1761882 RepID=UPI001404FBA4|nr:SusC/RagA family TonB-linked outer membrane protein [Pedobacter sp. ok626]